MTYLPNALRRRKTGLAFAAAGGAAVALAASLIVAGPAQALPPPQSACLPGSVTITPASGYVPLMNALSFNQAQPQVNEMAMATADVSVVSGAEVRLAWAVNNNAPQEGSFGPANFANHQEFTETRTSFALFGISSGAATIQPFVRVSGPSGSSATLLHRCALVEVNSS